MNPVSCIARNVTLLFFLSALALARPVTAAEGQPGKATVRGILGHAQFARGNSGFAVLGPGMDLRPGDLIQTASKSAIELDFGDRVGTVRLTESAVMMLAKIGPMGTNSGADSDIQLDLRSGELLGNLKRVTAGSHFEIKTPAGLAQVVEGQFRVDTQGYVVVVEGKVLFAHVPAVGEPTANNLFAPPAVYFSPAEGVRPAPKPLVREVTSQLKSKMPRR
jgi:hypothetical protein